MTTAFAVVLEKRIHLLQCACGTPPYYSVNKFSVFSGLLDACRCKFLSGEDLAAESSQEKTYEALWRRIASPMLKCAIATSPRYGRVQAES